MNEAREVRGVCGGRPAILSVTADSVEVRQDGAAEATRIPLGEGVEVTLVERGATGLFGTAGVFLLALGGLWALNSTASPTTSAAVAGVGAVLLGLGFALRVSIVEVKGPGGAALAIACRGRERRAARVVVETLRIDQPQHARKPAASIAGFVGAELRSLVAGEAERRREYRLVAGAKADPELETRFVAARTRIALWNLLWTLAIPATGAAAAYFVGRRWGTTGALTATLGTFVVLVFVGLRALPRTQGLLARWLAPR